MRTVVIIGGGHNGLVAAAFLAKAGMRPIVLEQADRIGGCTITSEIAPGFRCPTLAHRAAIDPAIVRGLQLARHGLEILRPAAALCTPSGDGRMLTLWSDAARAAQEISVFSSRDAERYPQFLASVAATGRVLHDLLAQPAPSLDRPGASDLVHLLRTARRARALGKADAYRLLRWLSMPVADFVHEWFESEPLCAMVAGGGILGSVVGPRSSGSAAILLLLSGAGHPAAPRWTARGGIGAIAEALAGAARSAGAIIRLGARVQEIVIEHGEATGVVLDTGERLAADVVVSNLDPRRTLIGLVDSVHLPRELVQRVGQIRMRGTLAKVNYAVTSLPAFTSLKGVNQEEQLAALSGCVRLSPNLDAIERAFDAAKYGRYSDDPWIELTIPSIADPSLAPTGQHVVSAYVQFAPYGLRDMTWDLERDRLGDVTTQAIAGLAPGFERSVLARQVITPLDLERTYGLTGGQIFHGELALDQLFVARPLLGFARHQTPIRRLFLCGAGTHPGTGLDGRAGALAAKAVVAAYGRR